MTSKKDDFVLLIAEDNDDDAFLIRDSLDEARMASDVYVVKDGIEALEFLRRTGKYSSAPIPDLVMLDIRMPRKNGFEVLSEMRADPDLRQIPAVMLTGLNEKSEVEEGFIRGANAYLTKPVSAGMLPEAVHVLLSERRPLVSRENSPIEILIVEDNEDDILLLKEAFIEARLINAINIVTNGDEALRYLKRKGEYAGATTPGLILLDINMPGKNGFEVLDELKADADLKSIPVIMLSTSSRESDVVDSYEKGACSYVTKPVRFEEFQNAITQLAIYWLRVVRLPERPRAVAAA